MVSHRLIDCMTREREGKYKQHNNTVHYCLCDMYVATHGDNVMRHRDKLTFSFVDKSAKTKQTT